MSNQPIRIKENCPNPEFVHYKHSPKGNTDFGPVLNTIVDELLTIKKEIEYLNIELENIKEEIKNNYLSLLNEIRHQHKTIIKENKGESETFKYKYPFQNQSKTRKFKINVTREVQVDKGKGTVDIKEDESK